MPQSQALREGGPERILRLRVVERLVEPLRPSSVERDVGLDLVTDVESRREARLQWTLAQQTARKAVQRLDGGLIEVVHGVRAPFALRWTFPRIDGGPFELLRDALAQFGRGGLSERDGRDAAHARPSCRYEGDDTPDEARRLPRARARLDDHVLVEAFDDRVTGGPVGRDGHRLPPSSASDT